MTAAFFQILLSLSDAQRHGYGIIREVQERTSGGFLLGPGTLYRSIRRMALDGLIERCDCPSDEAGGDERRIFYRITAKGRAEMLSEAKRLLWLIDQIEEKDIFEGSQ